VHAATAELLFFKPADFLGRPYFPEWRRRLFSLSARPMLTFGRRFGWLPGSLQARLAGPGTYRDRLAFRCPVW
ncbi:MAG: hypothetical protein WA715_15795, partial [Candidatus Acidiferrum sp.]